jgi:signal transduction histidine kinase
LKESLQLQEGLRQLTHQVLAAQEDERKKISRELQDEIAQTLLGINVRLLSLKQEARTNTKGLKNEIASTQRLVVKSAKSVRRPPVNSGRHETQALNFRDAIRRRCESTCSRACRPGLESARGLGSQAWPPDCRRWTWPNSTSKSWSRKCCRACPAGKRDRAHQAGGNFLCRGDHPDRENASQRAGGHRPPEKIHRDVEPAHGGTGRLEPGIEPGDHPAQGGGGSAQKKRASLLAVAGKSERLQEQLRRLSRQILSAQEEERKKISRELHDVIAQTLTGINIRLAALKKEAAVNTKGLDRNIARTQRLVEKSVNIVHQFARELRPAVLDDLGLDSRPAFLCENFFPNGRRPRSFDRLCGVEQWTRPSERSFIASPRKR